MKSELIVDVQAGEFSIALLEDGRLVSLQKEARNIAYAVGDIYLAKVKKLMPGLNAAFVNVGYEKDAFLHYLDLGPHFATYSDFLTQLMADRKHVPQLPKMKILPDIDKHGSVAQTLTPGQELLVQIVKEPISSKGPRLTTEISFTGRYLVLTPFNDKISISQKIKSSEEKLRLRQLIEFIKPRNFGVIVRTSAEGKKSAELDSELKALLQCFEDACTKAQKSEAPALVFEEENRVVGMLRDVFSPSFESIYVNDADIYQQILKYVSIIAPDRKDIVKLYTKDTPIFDHFGITRQIKSSFAKATNDQESNALEVNLRAADEIARQLRLRDMGGIIVVDFIDMAKPEHRQQLYDHMREIMANDRARHNILPLSKFGLMQITRQRVRPVLDIHVAEQCPSCLGKGEVQPSLLFTDTLREKLEYIVETLGIHDFVMYVHPYVDAYIKKGLFTSMYGKWRRALGRTFKILPDESLAYLQYRVVDKDRNELDLIDEKDSGESSKSKKDNKARKRGGDTDDTPATEQPQQQPKSQAKPEPKEQPKQQPKSQSKEQPKQQQQPKPKPQPKPQPKEQQPKAQVKEQPRPQPKPIAQPKDELPAEEPKELPTEERSALLLPEPTATPDLLDIVAEPEAEPDTDVADDTDGGDTEAKAKTRRRRRRKPRPKSDTTPQPEE